MKFEWRKFKARLFIEALSKDMPNHPVEFFLSSFESRLNS